MENEELQKTLDESLVFESDILQLVTFNVGEEEFAVDILNVQEINRMTDLTRVPNSPAYIKGVINLRGKVIPIIDLRKRLELAFKENDSNTRIIVIEINEKVVGFIVDRVNEVMRISKDNMESPPTMVSGIDKDFITYIAKLEDRLLILLDLEKVIRK
jgi:purine-binding chemotaxis protein CheW